MNQASSANVFYPLSPRNTMLLATIFTQGGQDDLPLLELLGDEDAYMLQERAEALLELDGDKRVAVVVREMRRLIQFAGLAGLEQIDPTWLLAAVKGEQPHTIGIILAQLSAGARSRILSHLPTRVRQRVPSKEDLRGTRPEVMRLVRQKFESKFAPMPQPPSEPTNFYFKDIALFDARELVQLVRALGVDQLAAAFSTMGKRALAELCLKLGRAASNELIAAVKETEERDAMDINEANNFLSRMVLGLKSEGRPDSPDAKERYQRELFQKAGLFRLAEACRGERPQFVQQLAQRIPRMHGKLLKNYVYRLNEDGPPDDARLRRLQDLVLLRVERLATRGKINPRYLKFTFCFWGEDEDGGDDGGGGDGEAYEEEYAEDGYE